MQASPTPRRYTLEEVTDSYDTGGGEDVVQPQHGRSTKTSLLKPLNSTGDEILMDPPRLVEYDVVK